MGQRKMNKERIKKKHSDKDLPTVKKMRSLRWVSIALKAGSYATCVVPASVMLACNWNEWFGQGDNQLHIGLGFGMLIVSTLATIFAVMKKDSDFFKKYSSLFPVAIGLLMWGGTCYFLSQLAYQFSEMLLYTAIGVACAAIEDEVNELSIKPKLAFYKKLVDEYGLSKKSDEQKKAEEQARKDREVRREWNPVD